MQAKIFTVQDGNYIYAGMTIDPNTGNEFPPDRNAMLEAVSARIVQPDPNAHLGAVEK